MAAVASASSNCLYTRQEVASKLRIHLATLDRIISAKKLPVVKIGKRILISEDDLNDFINKGRGC